MSILLVGVAFLLKNRAAEQATVHQNENAANIIVPDAIAGS